MTNPIGIVDEYGTIWAGEPGASDRIGDLIPRKDEETWEVHLECDRCDTTASCKITGNRCLHE